MTRRRWSVHFGLTPVLFTLGVVPFAVAGPNADGVLLVHANPSLVYTSDTLGYCGQSGLVACSLAVTTVPWAPDTTRVFFVLAAFPENSQPRLKAISFGVDWDPEKLVVLDHGTCADFELPDNSWPDPGTGVGQSWGQVKTGLVTEAYWFAAYTYSAGDAPDTTSFAVIPHQLQGAVMVDDATPPNEDQVVAFGRLGFGTAGTSHCPAGGDSGGDSSGGGEDPEGGDEEEPDGGGAPEGPDQGGTSVDTYGCAPNLVLIRFGANEVSFPQENPSLHEHFVLPPAAAEFARSDLADRLAELGVQTLETVAPQWRHVTNEEEVDIHGRHVDLVDFTDTYRLALDGSMTPESVVDALSGLPGIVYVECDPIVHPFDVPVPPSDPAYPCQWYLNMTAGVDSCETDSCWIDFDIKAPEAWALQDHVGTKIGICDYAINTQVPGLSEYVDETLSASFVPGLDWRTTSPQSHGTKVASVVGAGTQDSLNIASLSNLPSTHDDDIVVALRVLAGAPEVDSTSARADRALAYVCTSVGGAVGVVNLSWGFPLCSSSFNYSKTLRDLMRNAFLCDINLVCAAGNDGLCVPGCVSPDTCFVYPAAFEDYSLAVAAVDCRGRTDPDFKIGSYIDLAAPGSRIHTLDPDTTYFDPRFGTSLAAPFVSAAIALMLGAEPSLTNEDCYQLLKLTARGIPGTSPVQVGSGMLDVAQALYCLVPPRLLIRDSVATFQSLSYEGSWYARFANVPGLNQFDDDPKRFRVQTHKITSNVMLAGAGAVLHAWPRGRACSGWKRIAPDETYDYRAHSNDAVLEEREGSAAVFSSYTYEVFAVPQDTLIGWFPYHPDSAYTVAYSYILNSDPAAVQEQTDTDHATATDLRISGGAGQWTLTFPVLRHAAGSIEIYDAAGRRIRLLPLEARPGADAATTIWDERNDLGRRVPSGIYFLRLGGGGRVSPNELARGRILIVR